MINPIPPSMSRKQDIPTPALMIDLTLMEANLAKMAAFFANRPTKLRPHFKTHKCPIIAQKQMQAGAIGITCAKLGEAEILVEAGIPSILIANQIVAASKIRRLAELARQTEMIVAVDCEDNLRQHAEAAQAAGSTVNVVVEVNVGLDRCGVEAGYAALPLAELASRLPGIRLAGVMGYEGHAMFEADREVRHNKVKQAMAKLVETAELIRRAGLPVEIVSGGGSGTYDLTGTYPGVTEVQAGSYPFMDTAYQHLGLPFQPSLTLLATVISTPTPERVVIDAGMKAITLDHGLPEVLKPAHLTLKALHEEHGILALGAGAMPLKPGDCVELLPSHVCTTVNLHDWYYVMCGDRIEALWPISARGRFQ